MPKIGRSDYHSVGWSFGEPAGLVFNPFISVFLSSHKGTAIPIHTRHLLFVCTGNTCRSPMASGIARSMVDQLGPSDTQIEIDSAGVAAGSGMGASAQAVEVLAERGIDLCDHASKPLTPELIQWADVIYAMTPSHAQAVLQLDPDASGKVFPLDASHPIADPIGQSVEVYRVVADELERLIRTKLEERVI